MESDPCEHGVDFNTEFCSSCEEDFNSWDHAEWERANYPGVNS